MDGIRPRGGAGSRRSEQAAAEARLVGGCEARGEKLNCPALERRGRTRLIGVQRRQRHGKEKAVAWEGRRRGCGEEQAGPGRAEGSGAVGEAWRTFHSPLNPTGVRTFHMRARNRRAPSSIQRA
jgi:hypothetical protein